MLNPFSFYKKNKKKAIILIIILTLSLFSILTIISLNESVHQAGAEMILSPLSKFSIIRENIQNSIQDTVQLYDFENAESMYKIGLWYTNIKTLFGDALTIAVMTDNEISLNEIFMKCGLVLEEGDFPQSQNDVIVHHSILLNLNRNIGDTFLSGLNIVGSFQGEAKLAFGIADFDVSNDLLIFPKQGRMSALNQELVSLNAEEWNIINYENNREGFESDLSNLLVILVLIISLVAISISIAVGALIYTIYLGRLDEFAIYNALGYERKVIRKLLIYETTGIAACSFVLGNICNMVALKIVDQMIFKRMGQSIQFFSAEGQVITLFFLLFTILSTVIPVMHKLNRTDLVSVIERR